MSVISHFDPWRSPLCPCPPKYTLNPYTGCGFKCLYCYITSYIKDGFRPRPKKNILKRLREEVGRINDDKVIAISYSTDPYTPPEGRLGLTRNVLKILVDNGFSILIATKSPLVLRDIDILERAKSVVSVTITTIDEALSKKLEPNAPSPYSRLRAIEKLIEKGIPVSLRIDPIIPFINDDFNLLRDLIKLASSLGVSHVVSSVYKAKPDSYKRLVSAFPNIKEDFKRIYIEFGIFLHGYRYAPYQYRYSILKRIRDLVKKYGMNFTTCREGMRYLDDIGTFCDASHLIR